MANKKTRQQKIKKHILKTKSIPNDLEKLAKKLDTSEKTLKKDLQEINPELFNQAKERLALDLLLHLWKNYQNLSESQIVKLFTALSKKNENQDLKKEIVSVHLSNFNQDERL